MWSVLVGECCNPSSLQLLDIFCPFVLPFAHWDGEVGESSVVLLIPLRDRVEYLLVRTDPSFEVFDPLLVATPLLYVVCFALLKGDGEPTRDGSKRVGVDVIVVVAIEDGEGGVRRNRGGERDGVEDCGTSEWWRYW
jgi:hypothetical protein